MKTIIVFINSMNAPGGIERVVSNLLKEWVKQYHIILLVKDDEQTSFYKIPDLVQRKSINEPLILDMCNRKKRIKEVFWNTLRSHRKLTKYLKHVHYDYIYTTTPLNSLEVFWANPKASDKLVISEHASAYAVNGVYQKIKKYVYPKAKIISVPNTMDCSVYNSWKGVDAVYIPHLFTFPASEQNSLDTKIALNVGRYTVDKRQGDLIRIWAKIKDKRGWQLWLVGKGEEKINLEKMIVKYHLEKSVKLISETKDIAQIYRQASLFLFTSRMEGFGMVLLEAMSFGIPCISYDCPSGPRDVVKDQENGYLIPNDNQEMFSDAVQRAVTLPHEELLRLGSGAFKTVKKWDNEKIVKKWEKVFR
jgi:glycosyltransferase involved in cell wall biosynthesis